MVNPDQMIRPFARYHELYQKRGFHVDSSERARRRFSKKDLLDLQCWSNLVWFHPLAFESDAELAEFRKKGRHYTEKEKLWLLERQMEYLRQVVPLHAKLEQRGQIELTTTPFYHPILPLLWDKRLARRAMPDVKLPKHPRPLSRRTSRSRCVLPSSTTSGCSARNRGACGPPKARSARA